MQGVATHSPVNFMWAPTWLDTMAEARELGVKLEFLSNILDCPSTNPGRRRNRRKGMVHWK